MGWVVGVVAAVVVLGTYVTWVAARVDRLHTRATAARRALDAQLVRRAAAAAVLAENWEYAIVPASVRSAGGPAAAVPVALAEPAPRSFPQALYAAARGALDAPVDDREAAENDLTRQVRLLDEQRPAADPTLVAALVSARRRVVLARQVHSDLVRDALGIREHLLVRWLGLARKHPRPTYFDSDL